MSKTYFSMFHERFPKLISPSNPLSQFFMKFYPYKLHNKKTISVLTIEYYEQLLKFNNI